MPDASLLAVDLKVRQAALALHVRFETNAPWTCLFGASGSGKTTVLRAIAGLVRPDGGSVRVGGQVITDVAGGVRVAPHRRGLRMAAQQAYLFRGSVQRNVGYAARAEIVEELLERFRLTPLAETDVSRLSGGERQRVSLARAVGAAVAPADGEPVRLLLLDEPFTGMDAALRDQLAEELRDWLAEARGAGAERDP